MTRSDDERVADILEAATEIQGLVGEERRRRYPDVPWTDVVGLRVVLAHHYHRVDPDQVWTLATVEIPALIDALTRPGDG